MWEEWEESGVWRKGENSRKRGLKDMGGKLYPRTKGRPGSGSTGRLVGVKWTGVTSHLAGHRAQAAC